MKGKTRKRHGFLRSFISVLLTLILLFAAACVGVGFYVDKSTSDQIIGTMVGDQYLPVEGLNNGENSQASGFISFDCIMILGASVQSDGTPSPMLKDRLDLGITLFESGYSDTILVSGDNGTIEYNEIKCMRDYLVSNGIPEANIACDYAGFSTYDSMYRAKNIFGAGRVLIVTQSYHLPRALYIGHALGLDVYGAGADQEEYSGRVYRNIREVLARDKDFILCFFKPEASVMGEKENL